MVNTLREFGGKTSAKATTIERQMVQAVENFNNIREGGMTNDETIKSGFQYGINNSPTGSQRPSTRNQRLIVITISLDEKITQNDEAYKNLLDSIDSLHNSGLLQDTDFICYNIGSPLLHKFITSDQQKFMPDFNESFAQYQDLIDELRERSETYHILTEGKGLRISRVIKEQTDQFNQKKKDEMNVKRIYQITRSMVHTAWAVISLLLLYQITNESACLVKDAYPKPYMVYEMGSPGYEDQLLGFGDDIAAQEAFLHSLGDLYETYNFNSRINFRLHYGPEDTPDYFEWWNFKLYLQLLCICTIFLEIFQVITHVLMLYGMKMRKGCGYHMKPVFAFIPLLALIVFFLEIKYVFGFMGDTCFCRFKQAWTYIDDSPYHCMDDIGNMYRSLVYFKLVFVSISLFFIFL